MVRCWTCGHENPEDARFCMNCGSPLEGEQPAAREERKVVTVFFADLVGFTGRAEQLDPEDVRAMLSPYYARLRSEIERFGGTVEKFIGDAVMAVFGAPVTHEDDPERAVRAALAAPRRRPGAERGRPVARPARPHRGQYGRGRRRPRLEPLRAGRAWSPATSSTRPPGSRAPRRWTGSSSARRPTGRPSG